MKKVFSGKFRWLIIGVILLVIAGGAFYYYRSRTTQRIVTATIQTPVQTATAFKGNIVLSASGTGTLIPSNEVSFGFGTNGQVTELDVKIGDHVDAGQVLGKIDDTAVQAAYDNAKRNLADLSTPAAVAQAEQTVAQSEVDVANALADLKHIISPDVYYWEGQVSDAEQALKTAQTAGGSNPTVDQKKKIDDASTALNHAQSNLQAAKVHYINVYVPAFFTYTITDPDTGDTSTQAVPPSDADVAAARATYQLAIEKQKEAQAYLDLLNGKALPQDVPGSSLTSLVDAQNALQTAQENLKATQLVSPITGTVTDLTTSVGDYAGTSTVVTVADLSQPYTVDAYFDAEDWASIKAGYDTQFVFDILPDNTFTGKVTEVYPTLDTSSNTSLVHAIVKLNQVVQADLPVGATVAVDVISGKAENAVLIPVEALHEPSPGKYAVFVEQNGKLQLKLIEIGLKDLTHAEVKSGLNIGDIVTTGITRTQ